MLGNVLDNAWKWTTSRVDILFLFSDNRLTILIDDDKPGLAPDRRQVELARGARADERVPGTGLGMAIVSDLAQLYDGSITLDASPLGGLWVRLTLPAAPRPS